MPPAFVRCAVCPVSHDLVGVVVGGETILLCGSHAAKVGEPMPADFDELAARLRGEPYAGPERRVTPDRRVSERRFFPRPETRRLSDGRRATDLRT